MKRHPDGYTTSLDVVIVNYATRQQTKINTPAVLFLSGPGWWLFRIKFNGEYLFSDCAYFTKKQACIAAAESKTDPLTFFD